MQVTHPWVLKKSKKLLLHKYKVWRICWNTETAELKLTLQLFRNDYHWSLLGLRGNTQKNNFYSSILSRMLDFKQIRPLRTLNTLICLCLIKLTHTHFPNARISGFRRAQHPLSLQLWPTFLLTSLMNPN